MKKLLFLAPQPFFQERGTPIAVRLALTVLAKRGGDNIELLTYHEGESIEIPGVTIHRIWAPKWLRGLRPGISIKKLLCDVIFLFKTLQMAHAARSNQYQLIHAVEESVFIACIVKAIYGIPFIYDMDSSLAMQLTEKWTLLKPLQPIFDCFEKYAISQSKAVVPVCDSLAAIAQKHGSKSTTTLYDISLLDKNSANSSKEDLRATCGIPPDSEVVLYIGNLESYQGIDLLVESFAKIHHATPNAHLVIIGGTQKHIDLYKRRSHELGIQSQVHLIGPRPVSSLYEYLIQATVLVSPRTVGNNTPMKIYSYLHSNVPVLATNLPTHTQVLDSSVAMLAAPNTDAFGEALQALLTDSEKRADLATNAFARAEERYTYPVFEKKLNDLYNSL